MLVDENGHQVGDQRRPMTTPIDDDDKLDSNVDCSDDDSGSRHGDDDEDYDG